MWPYYVVQSTQSRAWNVLCYSVLYWVPVQLQYISPVLRELWYIFSVNISSDERVVSACFSRGRVHKLSHMIVPMVSRFIGIRRYMPLCLLHWKTEHPWKFIQNVNERGERKKNAAFCRLMPFPLTQNTVGVRLVWAAPAQLELYWMDMYVVATV